MKARDVPLETALKYLCDSTVLRYRVCENGVVEFISHISQPDELNLPAASSEQKENRTGNTDTFGNDPGMPEDPDPFAEAVESGR
jgi:hypothetical protein